MRREQFGFRQQHSTVHQLKRVTNFIQRNKANRKTTCMVLLDIEKAFDTIWHDGLIHKLKKMQTPMYLLKIIQSFTSDRKFRVVVNDDCSNSKNVVAGAPQGSCLSPTLYAIYTSDYRCESATKTTNKSIKNIQCALQPIEKFMSKWKIKLNASKTQSSSFRLIARDSVYQRFHYHFKTTRLFRHQQWNTWALHSTISWILTLTSKTRETKRRVQCAHYIQCSQDHRNSVSKTKTSSTKQWSDPSSCMNSTEEAANRAK